MMEAAYDFAFGPEGYMHRIGKLDMVARREPAPGVSRTRYSDGTEVTMNRSEEDFDGINPSEVRWERSPTGR